MKIISIALFFFFLQYLFFLYDEIFFKFADVIVAAPYENDGSGTIYIFSGHRFGLHKTFSQKIQGKNFQQNIQSFGISFSRTADIDSNGYEGKFFLVQLQNIMFIFLFQELF